MKKEETIERYGEAAWQKKLEQARVWNDAHPEEVIAKNHEQGRKGGKRYAKKLIYKQTGLQGERNKIRYAHGRQYRDYKKIIAPESQIHHQWIPQSASYTGLALVEKDQHMRGFVDVIEVLKGRITVFTEEEIREQ